MSGDRHLRPDPDGRLGGSPATLATVLVKASPTYARTIAGQHLLQLIVNLLARQFGVVRAIVLDVPDCDLIPGVIRSPRIDHGDLRSGLVTLGTAVGGGLTHTHSAPVSPPTIAVYVGDGLDPTRPTVPTIAVSGNGWRAQVSTVAPVPQTAAVSPSPLGPYLAACIAAGFAFKSAYGKQTPVNQQVDLWRVGAGNPPELEGVVLPAAYVLGLGAVGAAFAHTLAAAPGLSGQLIGVDPQTMSDTDANRLLSGTSETSARSRSTCSQRCSATRTSHHLPCAAAGQRIT